MFIEDGFVLSNSECLAGQQPARAEEECTCGWESWRHPVSQGFCCPVFLSSAKMWKADLSGWQTQWRVWASSQCRDVSSACQVLLVDVWVFLLTTQDLSQCPCKPWPELVVSSWLHLLQLLVALSHLLFPNPMCVNSGCEFNFFVLFLI